MNKILVLVTLLFLISIDNACSATVFTWNLHDAVGWGDGTMPDGDSYGNESVWYYQYAATGDFSTDAYSDCVWNTNLGIGFGAWVAPTESACGISRGQTSCNMHPGTVLDSAVSFVAPYTSEYTITLRIASVDGTLDYFGCDGQRFYIYLNDTLIDSYYNTHLGSVEFNYTLTLNENDSFILRVNKNEYTSHDSVEIQEFTLETTIPDEPSTAIPEPLTLISLGIAICSIKHLRSL